MSTGRFERSPNTLIRESLAALHVQMDGVRSDIRELKSDTAQDFKTQNTQLDAQDARLKSLEKKQAWTQAWAAGALFILGVLAYLVGKIPTEAWLALAKALVR